MNQTVLTHMAVVEDPGAQHKYNESLPPDTLWLRFSSASLVNKSYSYIFRGGVERTSNPIDIKVCKPASKKIRLR